MYKLVAFILSLSLLSSVGRLANAADEIVYFHPDVQGSAIAAYSEGGALCWKQDYTPYGEKIDPMDGVPTSGCGLLGGERGFTGHVQDVESGLVYMQQRYYDPMLMRFRSVDPVGVIPEDHRYHNRYSYAANNPMRYIDPDGRNITSGIGSFFSELGESIAGAFGFGDGGEWEEVGPAFASGYNMDGGVGGFVLAAGEDVLNLAGGAALGATVRATKSAIALDRVRRGVPNPGGRLGKDSTRQHVDDVAEEMEKRGFTITRGGNRYPEEYLPGPGGSRKGSSFPDITATKNGRTLRVNTVDTRVDGVTPTTREATNAARIRAQTPGDHLLLIPKPK